MPREIISVIGTL